MNAVRIAAIVLIAIGNLRGIREAGNIFAAGAGEKRGGPIPSIVAPQTVNIAPSSPTPISCSR